jgi:hypothetical protein
MKSSRVALLIAFAIPLTVGFAAVAAASAFDAPAPRIALQCVAITAATVMAWRAGSTRAQADAGARGDSVTPASLGSFRKDGRLPTFDHETGLCTNWYFRLRAEEEIARAARYRQPLTILTLTAPTPAALNAPRMAMKQWLRGVDFAGDLGNAIAILLPNTDRAGAEQVVGRLANLAKGAQVRLAEYPTDGQTLSHLLGDDEWRISEQAGLVA